MCVNNAFQHSFPPPPPFFYVQRAEISKAIYSAQYTRYNMDIN